MNALKSRIFIISLIIVLILLCPESKSDNSFHTVSESITEIIKENDIAVKVFCLESEECHV